ncbi:sigma factor G inhibitor Gin [Brevibacillus humidisoli]|uniref:sigma factor G inhibitor Gin n=1 Tax=Brevibacillus humidisoli TaxID=2895522 RepID=UPI001E4F4169|nr:sigma factor G inhibitor Gin [Brevibacillus humidisoli]UFJ40514.1 sigma factor G inhibitor Gin [Brevibacillus humidisoli]
MDRSSQRCIVCGEERAVGIAIWQQFICYPCEQEMVKTDVMDEKYPFFIKQMRQIWLKQNA